jgi:hypothetical protein
MVVAWFSAFVFTQVLEVPIYCAALGRRADPRTGEALARESWRWRVGFAFLASMATHPYVWFVIPSLFYAGPWDWLTFRWPWLDAWTYAAFFVAAESFAVVAEALLLRALRVPRAFLWALTANAVSALTGLVLRALVGWP